MPSTSRSSRPSAISLIVKSNSLRATKSIGAPLTRLSSGCTATLAPTMPISSDGLASFSIAATLTSEAKEGVEVCITTMSRSRMSSRIGSMPIRAGGASISRLSGISAAGCASQVGYQNDLISRLAW